MKLNGGRKGEGEGRGAGEGREGGGNEENGGVRRGVCVRRGYKGGKGSVGELGHPLTSPSLASRGGSVSPLTQPENSWDSNQAP